MKEQHSIAVRRLLWVTSLTVLLLAERSSGSKVPAEQCADTSIFSPVSTSPLDETWQNRDRFSQHADCASVAGFGNIQTKFECEAAAQCLGLAVVDYQVSSTAEVGDLITEARKTDVGGFGLPEGCFFNARTRTVWYNVGTFFGCAKAFGFKPGGYYCEYNDMNTVHTGYTQARCEAACASQRDCPSYWYQKYAIDNGGSYLGYCELTTTRCSNGPSAIKVESTDSKICTRGAVEDGDVDPYEIHSDGGLSMSPNPSYPGSRVEVGIETTTTKTTTTRTTTKTTTTRTTTTRTTTTTTTGAWQHDRLLCKSSADYCSASDVMLGWKAAGGEENAILASDASFGPQAYLPLREKEVVFAKRRPNCSLSFDDEVAGKLVVMSRKVGCFFDNSVIEAQEAGAVGVIFFDNGDTNNDANMHGVYRMRASTMAKAASVTIPSIMIEKEFGARLVLAILSKTKIVGTFACDYTEANAPAGYSDGSYVLPDTDYILMDKASCDHGYSKVISQAECAGAAAKIRSSLTASNVVIGDFGDSTPNTGILLFPWPNKYPSGCYYMCSNAPDDQLFWNHAGVDPAGDNIDTSDLTRRSICKKQRQSSDKEMGAAFSSKIPAKSYDRGAQCILDDSTIPGLGRAVEGGECSGKFCTPDGICIPELTVEGFPWSASDFVPGMSLAECGRQAANAGLEAGLEGIDSFDCNAYEVLVACGRAAVDHFPVTAALMTFDITGTFCHLVEEVIGVFKEDAAKNGCEVFDLFASECFDYIEEWFGFSLRDFFVVDLIIDGVVWVVGKIGVPVVKFVVKVIKSIFSFFFGGGQEKAITYYAACASSDSTTSDGKIIGEDGDETVIKKEEECSGLGCCFPGNAEVELESGAVVTMSALQVGDFVRASASAFSKVYMFTHQDAEVKTMFVKISTARKTIRLSPGHYLYVNGKLQTARSVQAGDAVSAGNVLSVSLETAVGLYNPHTMTGDIVVNGILTSTYTEIVPPSLAHTLLWPARLLNHYAGIQVDGDWNKPNSTLGHAWTWFALEVGLI